MVILGMAFIIVWGRKSIQNILNRVQMTFDYVKTTDRDAQKIHKTHTASHLKPTFVKCDW